MFVTLMFSLFSTSTTMFIEPSFTDTRQQPILRAALFQSAGFIFPGELHSFLFSVLCLRLYFTARWRKSKKLQAPLDKGKRRAHNKPSLLVNIKSDCWKRRCLAELAKYIGPQLLWSACLKTVCPTRST
jgi:hypothetical protein